MMGLHFSLRTIFSIGITRRGFLALQPAEHATNVETRARDIIAVLDAFGIRKATFVGHSSPVV